MSENKFEHGKLLIFVPFVFYLHTGCQKKNLAVVEGTQGVIGKLHMLIDCNVKFCSY